MENKLIFGTLALLSIVIIGTLAGCLGSTEINGGAVVLNLNISISGTADTVQIEVISGTGDWSDYQVLVDGSIGMTTTISSFSAGSEATFLDTAATWDPVPGTSYDVRVVDIGDDLLVYQDTIIATA